MNQRSYRYRPPDQIAASSEVDDHLSHAPHQPEHRRGFVNSITRNKGVRELSYLLAALIIFILDLACHGDGSQETAQFLGIRFGLGDNLFESQEI